MKSVLLKLDPDTLRLIDEYVPRRQRKRSEFIRTAIRHELDRLIEAHMEAAYRRLPQQPDEGWTSPDEWAPHVSRGPGIRGQSRGSRQAPRRRGTRARR